MEPWIIGYIIGFFVAIIWVTVGPGSRLFDEEPGEEGDVLGGVFVFLWFITLPVDIVQWARGK